MTSRSLETVVTFIASAAGLVAAALTSGADMPVSVAIFAVMAAVSVLEIPLPDGETLDPGIALIAPALVLLPFLPAVLICASARAAASACRRLLGQPVDVRLPVLARIGVVLAAGAVSRTMLLLTTEVVSAVAVSAVAITINFGLGQWSASLRLSQRFTALVQEGIRLQGWLNAAQLSLGVLAVLVHPIMGVWSLLMVGIMLLIMRQSFALLLQMRNAHSSIVDMLTKAFRALPASRGGSLERLPEVAVEVGRRVGVQGDDLERLRYAALFRSLGVSDVRALDSATEGPPPIDVVSHVHFLRDLGPILKLLDGAPLCEELSLRPRERVVAAVVALCEHQLSDGCNEIPTAVLAGVPSDLVDRVTTCAEELACAPRGESYRLAAGEQ